MSELSALIATYLLYLKMGKESALDEIYRLCSSRMFALALGILKNRTDAEDAVQNAFVKVVENADKFKGGNGYGFVMKITQNAALDLLRKKGRHAEVNIDDCFSITSYDAYDEDKKVTAITLEEAIKQLPEREKELIYYRYYLDLTIREIAGKTGSSKSQVQRDLDEAEKKLKIFLLSGTKGRIETL